MKSQEVIQAYRTVCNNKPVVDALNLIIEDLRSDFAKNLQIPTNSEDLIRLNGGYAAVCGLQNAINRDPKSWDAEAQKLTKKA